MSWITINADFRELVSAMNRIAECLERAWPPPKMPVDLVPAPPENLTVFDGEAECTREEEEERQRIQGLRSAKRTS